MRAADVVGRRIVAVKQVRCDPPGRPRYYHLDELVLSGGVRLRFTVREEDSGPHGVSVLLVERPEPEPRKRAARLSLPDGTTQDLLVDDPPPASINIPKVDAGKGFGLVELRPRLVRMGGKDVLLYE